MKRLKTIAGRLVRELQRKLPASMLDGYIKEFYLFNKGLCQKRGGKNKSYSLHEPHVYCMSKSKTHKPYEFGTKVSITTTRDSKIIIGAMTFSSNKFDGHTLPEVLLQTKRMIGHLPEVALCDRGYKRKSKINNTRIIRPSATTKDASGQHKELMRQRFRKRAGIKPVIGHLKSDHRLNKSYLKGFTGNQINILMAAAAFNFKTWMRLFFTPLKMVELRREIICWIEEVRQHQPSVLSV